MNNQYRELILLRHAKADQGLGLADFDRPLNQRGKESARRMGHWLKEQLPDPGLVLCSPTVRTWETCHLVLEAMDRQDQIVHWQRGIYEAKRSQLLAVLSACPKSNQVLLIGHNPGLEDLLLWLAEEGQIKDENAKLLPTAGLAWLELPRNWGSLEKGCGRLKELIHPRDL